MIWTLFTLLAAASQAIRNALQSKLSRHLDVTGVTFSRFILAAPLAALYLVLLYSWQPTNLPQFNNTTIAFVICAAVMQILATNLMVLLFKQQNYAIGAGLAKLEAPAAALISTIFLGTQFSALGWLGICLGAVAVLMLSSNTSQFKASLSTVAIGIACSTSFAITSLCVREASHTLTLPYLHSSAWILFSVLSLQTLLLTAWILCTRPSTFSFMFKHRKWVALTSLSSFIGSLGWFTAMSLQAVAYVKTLGQVEVLFTLLISYFVFKEQLSRKVLLALVLIMIAAILVI